VPELPEAESARQVVEHCALDRRIDRVEDVDPYVCRPHAASELGRALHGRRLSRAHRRGKLIWCETAGPGRRRTPGPVLAIHLGMSGRIVVDTPGREPAEGGDYLPGRPAAAPHRDAWSRFALRFADGGRLRLLDPRRLGRVRLDPDLDALGPDAGEIGRREFRERVGRGTAPVKARLLDQQTLAGVGNLLADEALWQSSIDPRRPAGRLDEDELDELRRRLRQAIRRALRHGGVGAGEIVAHRGQGEHCPRCGAEMRRATVGGRTTWWCPREQS
jgi:formamidopyrimidine-DNA glycosylase